MSAAPSPGPANDANTNTTSQQRSAVGAPTRPSHDVDQYRKYGQTTQSPAPNASQRQPLAPQQRPSYSQSTPQSQSRSNIANTRPSLNTSNSYQSQSQPRSNTYSQPSAANGYRAPPPLEAYTLPDAVDSTIPDEIRERFQRDEHGRIIFFTAPPIHLANGQYPAPTDASVGELSHSLAYRAIKQRRASDVAQRRKEYEAAKAEARTTRLKRAREEDMHERREVEASKRRAMGLLEDSLLTALSGDLLELYGPDGWRQFI